MEDALVTEVVGNVGQFDDLVASVYIVPAPNLPPHEVLEGQRYPLGIIARKPLPVERAHAPLPEGAVEAQPAQHMRTGQLYRRVRYETAQAAHPDRRHGTHEPRGPPVQVARVPEQRVRAPRAHLFLGDVHAYPLPLRALRGLGQRFAEGRYRFR